MDCASKRITQGHRILKPKQVRREILIPSIPFHTRAKLRETLRLNAAYTASKPPARTPTLASLRSKHLSSIITDLPIKINTLNLSKWKAQVGFHYPLLLIPNRDAIRNNQHVLLLFP